MMARPEDARAAAFTTWRFVLRFGPPLAGLLVIGHAAVISIGGDIEPRRHAFGVLPILGSLAGKLAPER